MPMRKMTLVAVAAMLGVLCTAANALEEEGQAYITPMGTWINPDGDIGGDPAESGIKGGQLAVGFAVEDRWNLELALARINLDGKNTNASIDQTGLALNVLNVYNRAGRFAPYLIGGVGFVNDDAGGSAGSENNFEAQGGVGMFTDLWGERVALRTEVLYRWEDATDSFGDWLVNVGFQIALGNKAKPAPAPVAAAAVPPPSPPPDTDSDGDGVVDRLDKCPGTRAGVKVDKTGCPLDSDGDGVADNIDQCPDTPKGDRVGPQGCSCDVTRQLQFAHNSADLTAEDKTKLDEMVENLNRLRFVAGTVVGHTDSTGSDAYNQKLSERRAKTVADYLQAKGIATGRLEVSGAGESEPIADNKTAEGRAQNRRVVLKRTDCEAPK